MNRLVLLDGNAILHRAYHALPPLTAPDGSIVNAVYGFTSVIVKLFNDFQPTHMAVAFDRPEPTFRKKLYTDYQAQRPEMEETLVSQIEKVHEVIRAFGIPIYDAAGFEADDVIGTIVGKCQMLNAKCQIIIVTGDKDILQLVEDERVLVYMPVKGLSEGKLYEEKDVVERLGVTPKQIPDLKALMGDSSDNYPGVSGIGPKTAVGLLHGAGSVEELYRNIKDLKGISDGIRAKLVSGKEDAMLSKNLATIRTDAPLDIDIEKMRITSLDTPEAHEVLTGLSFPSLIKRLTNQKEARGEKREEKKGRKKVVEKVGEQQPLF